MILLPKNPVNILPKIIAASAWVVYVGYLLLSDLPPGPSLLHTQPETIQEALDLSLNFWFVLPAMFPNTAPVINPGLEGLFNIVVAWGLLFWGFLIDGRHQRFPLVPFLIGTAFLTNVFYLLWLAVRLDNPEVPQMPLTRAEKFAESKFLPIFLTGVVVASMVWGLWARPEFGDLTARWESLLTLISSDRLAYSFWIDMIVFWLFQGWLVKDDMVRRNYEHWGLLWVVRILPLFGLVIYFLKRPSLAVVAQDK